MKDHTPSQTVGRTALGCPIRRQRADARLLLGVERAGGASIVREVAEAGSARLRFPRVREPEPEAVVLNTGGGIASGDRWDVDLRVADGAALVWTSAAAERIYRSEGAMSEVATRIGLGSGARLDWIPQETILFDRARLRRRLDVSLAPEASALLFEAVVFGRAAMGEAVSDGFYEERWRVRRGERLVYADTLRLDGPIAERLRRPEIGGGHRALATLLYVAPDAETRLDAARELLGPGLDEPCESGASAWRGLLAVRWLAPTIGALRANAARFMTGFRGRPLPRVWHL